MKVKERESWSAFNVGKGGKRPSLDQFNKAFKGHERNPRAEEYATKGIEEYHHYSERAEYKENEDDSKSKQQSDQKQSSSSNAAKNLITRCVSVVVSAVVIVSVYQTMTNNEASKTIEPMSSILSEISWEENVDKQTHMVGIYDAKGNLVSQVPATIEVERIEPTCNQEGHIKYTATAEYNNKTYTETQEETVKPLGHSFGEGKEVVLDNGQTAIVFECSRCHEQFTISTTIEEN